MKDLLFTGSSWEDMQYWEENNPKVYQQIKRMISEISRDPFRGIGKPEPLKHDYAGWWSRRINNTDRLIYKMENDALVILQCRSHYNK